MGRQVPKNDAYSKTAAYKNLDFKNHTVREVHSKVQMSRAHWISNTLNALKWTVGVSLWQG